MFKNYFLTFFLSTSLSAAIYHDIDTTGVLKCTVSSQHQNRILVENGAISKVITPTELFSIKLESESGQVFLYPLRAFEGSTTVSIVTESGKVQDVELSLEDKSSEVIVLKESEGTEEVVPYHSEKTKISKLEKLSLGEIPMGYIERPLSAKTQETPDHTLFFEPLRYFEGPFDEILLFEIKNISKKTVSVKEEELVYLGNNGVLVKENLLSPGQTSQVVVCRRKDAK